MALKRVAYTRPSLQKLKDALTSRRAWRFISILLKAEKLSAQAGVKRPLVPILVEVANIQMRTLKTEVEKGSM